jgi:hypothetical protein
VSYYYRTFKPGGTNNSGKTIYQVGHYKPANPNSPSTWEKESDFSSRKKAAARVHYLNGGTIIPDEGLPEVEEE